MPLTVIGIRSLTKPGRYTDGGGLHLHVRSDGRRGWVLRYTVRGRMRDMGLGSLPQVTLAQARTAANDARTIIRSGLDPIQARRASRDAAHAPAGQTFRDAATQLIKDRKAGWRSAKHADQWAASLAQHVHPVIGDRHVRDVDTAAVLQILRPLWATKTETASRLRGRIEAVLDAARAWHWRDGENPARWKGHLATVLPAPSRVAVVEHHPSLPWGQVRAFLDALRVKTGSSPRCIEFTILTAARSGEARGATRGELDMQALVWTVPPGRMKGKRVHRVPLSSAAVAFLGKMGVDDLAPGDLLFPSTNHRKALSDMSLTMMLRRMQGGAAIPPWCDARDGRAITVHGFRSTFRDWAGEVSEAPREVIEAALAHVVGDATEAAYARSDLLERRRALMEGWGQVCAG